MKPPVVMIFAAGLGTRMAPLTNTTPKPLLPVAGQPLIDYHLQQAKGAGIQDVVINVSHLGQQIMEHCGSGEFYGLKIHYSIETKPLETAGGILQAKDLLPNDQNIVLINGDIFLDWSLQSWLLPMKCDVELMLVPNPAHNLKGDFSLEDQRLSNQLNVEKTFTFAGVSRLKSAMIDQLFINENPKSNGLAFHLRRWVEDHSVNIHGRVFDGFWCDVGTPERLKALNDRCFKSTAQGSTLGTKGSGEIIK